MWKYGSETIYEGKSWVDDNGITHPPNWQIWSDSDKAAAGVTEIVLDATPDSRLYTWTHDAEGTITSTPIALATVKANFTAVVKSQQEILLFRTDWAVVRKAEKTTAIPSNISAWRDAIRTKATAMEAAIDGAADTAAVQVLIDNGSLADWPVLGS
jgi:hypothetical protein